MAKLLKRGRVWYSDLRMGGKRIRHALSEDKRTAETMLADLIKERSAKRHGHAPPDPLWVTFKTKFLAEQATKARPTYTIYKRAVAELEAFTTITRVSQVTPSLLSDLMTAWRTPKWQFRGAGTADKPVGLYMRNRMLRALKTMMTRAVAYKLIPPQEWASVKYDREPRGRLHWWTVEDLKKLLGACEGVWTTIALLGARAGLRRAEIYHLEWSDVDFERNRIHIAPKEGWNPKDYERRWVPMAPDLRAHLKAIRKPRGHVLGAERPSLDSISVYFARLVRKVGLTGSAHTLRHSFAAHLASAGVSMRKLQELLGHADGETTAIYSHLSPESVEDAVSRLPPL